MSYGIRLLVGAVVVSFVVLAPATTDAGAQSATTNAGAESPCSPKSEPAKSAKSTESAPALKPTVKLMPDAPATIVNFGGSQSNKSVDIVLNATPSLPASVTRDQVRVSVPRRFTRTSQDLPTELAPAPTYSQPEISPNRDRVTFKLCFSGKGLRSGSYAGSVYIEGPPGVGPATVGITENKKSSVFALIGAGAVLAAAFVFLVLRGAAARQVADEARHAEELTKAAATKNPDHVKGVKAVKGYVSDVFKDLNWYLTTLVALGSAGGAIIGLYKADPAWGADTLTSLASLVAPAFTAVGVQSVISTLGRSVTKS
jgi:hypothetical protein